MPHFPRAQMTLLVACLMYGCGADARDSMQPVPTPSDAGNETTRTSDAAAATDASADGAIVDASGSDAAAPACAAPGSGCATAHCCSGTTCVLTPDTRQAVCAAECSASSQCTSDCCVPLSNSSSGACVPKIYCDAPQDAGPPPAHYEPDAGSMMPMADAGSPQDGSIPNACVASGAVCTNNPCCAGLVCTYDPLTNSQNTCAPECVRNDQCSTGCCAPDINAPGVCLAASYCNGGPGSGGTLIKPAGCGDLILLADDGTYLGLATGNTVKSESVCNTIGSYGSSVSSTSIFNSVGRYGSTVGSLSAYNAVASRPPTMRCSSSGAQIAWITKNEIKISRIDPDQLCALLASNGL